MTELLLDNVLEMYKKKNWKGILDLNPDPDNEEVQKILWVWPNEANLNFLQKALVRFKVRRIISIGCGCGLLEWIIGEYTSKFYFFRLLIVWNESMMLIDPIFLTYLHESYYLELQVIGVEVNQPWWSSKYSVPNFIPLNYIENNIVQVDGGRWNALMFCYFNNGEAFRSYVRNFEYVFQCFFFVNWLWIH